MLLALVLMVSAEAPQMAEARPARLFTSDAYVACAAAAVGMADKRACLAAEVERGRALLAQAVATTPSDQHGQALWKISADHDCQGESDLAQGGSSADLRQMACQIELQADRIAYLKRRGLW